LQELLVYFGQLECYEKCPEILEKTIGIEVGHSQVHRVADTYGKELEKTIATTRILPPLNSEEVLYAEVDGSMIFTRDDDWKEVKVGRIFKSSDCIDPNGNESWIKHSQYLAYMGNSQSFTEKMEGLIESYGSIKQRLVFISDGAAWIRNWIEDAFPYAISILDYYHAIEHLYQFTDTYFKEKGAEKKWAEKQKELLLNSKVKQVIKNIEKLAPQNEAAKRLISYYQTNSSRMDYKKYKQIGCGIIGSGAIESAHRTIVQKRMKQSGQRWSSTGAQNMLNLRVTYMNEKWDNVIQLVKINFKHTNLKQTG
jgi:adenylate kinase family enzyme